jgi:MraZ protein
MDQFFFSGSFDSSIDDKNRFVLPQSFRYGLVEEGKLEFSLGLGLGGCLAIYKKSDIQKIVQKFQQNLNLAKYQKFFTIFFSTLFHTSCDKIGRVLIPARLKTAVKLEKEIVLAGVVNKIEIWPKAVYDQTLSDLLSGQDEETDLAKMTEEAFALLHEKKDEVSVS